MITALFIAAFIFGSICGWYLHDLRRNPSLRWWLVVGISGLTYVVITGYLITTRFEVQP